MIPPLAIVQARLHSTRLPRKMLLPVGGEPLVVRVWRETTRAVGVANVVCAVPYKDTELIDVLHTAGANVYESRLTDENDVLTRFYDCAHYYRWHPDTVILRVTPDDPWKNWVWMRRVIAGERVPVELGGEAFTLGQLDAAQQREPYHDGVTISRGPPLVPNASREHIAWALFRDVVNAPKPVPRADGAPWSIDTQRDYDAVVAALDEWAALARSREQLPRDQEGEL